MKNNLLLSLAFTALIPVTSLVSAEPQEQSIAKMQYVKAGFSTYVTTGFIASALKQARLLRDTQREHALDKDWIDKHYYSYEYVKGLGPSSSIYNEHVGLIDSFSTTRAKINGFKQQLRVNRIALGVGMIGSFIGIAAIKHYTAPLVKTYAHKAKKQSSLFEHV